MNTLSPIQTIEHPLFEKYQLNVFIKRDDLIHPIISGNKWRKLKHNIIQAKKLGFKGVLSFGGAYSNHIHALAFACYQNKIKSLAVIRGESHYQDNATLQQAVAWGMKCEFVDRQTYRLRSNPDYLTRLQIQYPDYCIVPEGGSNSLAMAGVGEVITELNQQLAYDTLMLPVGSGGTIAGLIAADNNQHAILGIAALKEADYLRNSIKELLNDHLLATQQDQSNKIIKSENWQLLTQFHRGGYAKFSAADEERIWQFNQTSQLTFEPVYSGKMLLAFLDLIEQGYFRPHEKIVLLHTGGLQGINGLIEQNKLSASRWR